MCDLCNHQMISYECENCGIDYEAIDQWSSRPNVQAMYGSAVMPDPDTNTLRHVNYVCNQCVLKYNSLDNRADCPICGNNLPIRDLCGLDFEIMLGDRIGCIQCVRDLTFYCSHCEERYPKRRVDRYITHTGSEVCQECFEEDYFVCEECDSCYPNDRRSRDEGSCTCRSCSSDSDRIIMDYNYKPIPNFFGSNSDGKSPIFYGCELEIYIADQYRIQDKAKEIIEKLNQGNEKRVYLKNDGSIGRGFEIVTHPHTWNEIKKLWTERWDERIRGISSHTAGTCGFHVHVSRKPLTAMHIQRMIVFVNAAENAYLIKTIAQRDCSEWGKLKSGKKIGHCMYGEERYEAVNVMNSNTIEFRIFRGNIRKDRILKNLEFVKATIDFTRDRSYRDLTASSFMKFIQSNRKEFIHLYTYLENTSFFPNPNYTGCNDSEVQ